MQLIPINSRVRHHRPSEFFTQRKRWVLINPGVSCQLHRVALAHSQSSTCVCVSARVRIFDSNYDIARVCVQKERPRPTCSTHNASLQVCTPAALCVMQRDVQRLQTALQVPPRSSHTVAQGPLWSSQLQLPAPSVAVLIGSLLDNGAALYLKRDEPPPLMPRSHPHNIMFVYMHCVCTPF